MRLIDLDQTIFVPIIDESQGGVKYEMQMTIAEVFDKFFDGVQPQVVDAVPVEWMTDKMHKPQMTCVNPFEFVLSEWLEGQGAR